MSLIAERRRVPLGKGALRDQRARGRCSGRARPAVTALALLFGMLSLLSARAETLGASAIPSRLATQSLLLDAVRAGDRLVAVGEWGHVVLSDDGGQSWRQAKAVPTQVTLTEAFFVDSQQGWAVGHDAVILHTSDGGETWELQYAAPEDEAPLLSVWFESAVHGLAVGAFGVILETRDGGKSWQRRALTQDPEQDYHLNQIFGGPHDSLFIAAEFGSVFRSRNGGSSWDRLQPPYEGSFWGGMSLDSSAVLVFGMRGHVFRSDDLGETWQELASGTDQSLQGATRLRDGSIVLVGLGGAVLTSGDGGRTFSAAIQPDRRGIADVAEGAGDKLLLFGEAGIQTRALGSTRSSE